MSGIAFSKFHGFGNDYIVIESGNIPTGVAVDALAREMCDRHAGVGSDGLTIVERIDSEDADFSCEIVNPDGSIAGFSGNGTRCAIAYLHSMEIWSDKSLRLQTRAGLKNYTLINRDDEGAFWFDAEIGKPVFASNAIPVLLRSPREAVVNEPIEIEGRIHGISAINVGNPVACVFVATFEFDWRRVGRKMEIHPAFPERTNVVFVKVIDNDNIELRIWERGAGETAASGTCSAGAAVLSAFLLKTQRTVNVHSPGGTTRVHWRDDDEMVLTGRADYAFSGTWMPRD